MQILNVSSESWITLHTEWLARAEYMPKWWFHHILELFHLVSSPGCPVSHKGKAKLLTYRRPALTWPRGSTGRERREAGWAVESASLQSYMVPLASVAPQGSQDLPVKLLNEGVMSYMQLQNSTEFWVLEGTAYFLSARILVLLNLTFAGCSSCSTNGTLGDGRSWSFRGPAGCIFLRCRKEIFHLRKSLQPKTKNNP